MAIAWSAYEAVLQDLKPFGAELIVVSKNRSVAEIQALYEAGQRIFGENRVQELLEKQQALPQDIQWHLIGTLQRNKVKYIAPFVACIHSLDRSELLPELNKQAEKQGRILDVLLQFHIAQESSKQGFTWPQAQAFLDDWQANPPANLRLCGLMGMGSMTEESEILRREFETLAGYFRQIKESYPQLSPDFKQISMGMSSDYPLALRAGATWVRVGSKLFVD